MKPNVTIRITCPGSQDVDLATFNEPTYNLVATVHEEDFGPYIFANSMAMPLPAHIFGAFKAMLESPSTNRIEIMQGITMYSCYRHPRNQVDTQQKEYEAQRLDNRDKSIQGEVLEVKEEDPDLFLVSSSQPLAPQEIHKANVNGEERVVTCGGHCPHARRCLSFNRCLANNPLTMQESRHGDKILGVGEEPEIKPYRDPIINLPGCAPMRRPDEDPIDYDTKS